MQEKIRYEQSYHVTRVDPLSFVIDYRQKIDEDLQAIENQLNEHAQRSRSIVDNGSQDSRIDMASILKALVRRGQHRLDAEMKSKRRLLEFDDEAHRLTKAFFDLDPTREQVCTKSET